MSASLLPRCLDGTGVCWCLVLHGNPCGWTKSNSLHACEVHDQLMEIVRLEAPGSLAFWESTSHADKENTRQAEQRPCLSIVLLWPGPSDAQGQGALLASLKVPCAMCTQAPLAPGHHPSWIWGTAMFTDVHNASQRAGAHLLGNDALLVLGWSAQQCRSFFRLTRISRAKKKLATVGQR